MSRVGIDGLSDAISDELGLYTKEIVTGIKKETSESMKKLVKETKAQKYKGGRGRYKRAISSKVTKDTPNFSEETWYVKSPHYRLTHLLEDGHAKQGGGRTVAYGTLSKAMAQIEPDYLKRIEAIISGN